MHVCNIWAAKKGCKKKKSTESSSSSSGGWGNFLLSSSSYCCYRIYPPPGGCSSSWGFYGFAAPVVAAVSYLGLRGAPLYRRTTTTATPPTYLTSFLLDLLLLRLVRALPSTWYVCYGYCWSPVELSKIPMLNQSLE